MEERAAAAESMPPPKRPKMTRDTSSVAVALRRAGLVAKAIVGLKKKTLGTQAKPDEISRARELFNAHDSDSNGVLDYTEVRKPDRSRDAFASIQP